jgi:amino acid transporter
MWILIITMIIGGILILVFGGCKKISKESQATLSYAVWGITIIIFVVVLLSHSDFMTDTIEGYQEGRIVKQEIITVEDGDTIKVIKYKYK